VFQNLKFTRTRRAAQQAAERQNQDAAEALARQEQALRERHAVYAKHRETIHAVLTALGEVLFDAGGFRVDDYGAMRLKDGEACVFQAVLRKVRSTRPVDGAVPPCLDLLYVSVNGTSDGLAVRLDARHAHGSHRPEVVVGFGRKELVAALEQLVAENPFFSKLS